MTKTEFYIACVAGVAGAALIIALVDYQLLRTLGVQ